MRQRHVTTQGIRGLHSIHAGRVGDVAGATTQPARPELNAAERDPPSIFFVDTGRQVVVQSTGSEVGQGPESLWTRHMGFDADRHLVPVVRDRHTDAIRCYSLPLGWPKGPGPPFRRGYPPPSCISGEWVRELSIFIDESGGFGPLQNHSPLYILSLVFHDQSDDISGHLDKIHDALRARGLPPDHASPRSCCGTRTRRPPSGTTPGRCRSGRMTEPDGMCRSTEARACPSVWMPRGRRGHRRFRTSFRGWGWSGAT